MDKLSSDLSYQCYSQTQGKRHPDKAEVSWVYKRSETDLSKKHAQHKQN